MLVMSTAFSAPIQAELGKGLFFVRVHAVPSDLPARITGRAPPCIVDVRYVAADAAGAADFSAWLHHRATLRSPVFVLANAETSGALLKVLATHQRASGIVVIGIERGPFRPDIGVKASAEDERRAYDALEEGAGIHALITDNPDKIRNDEASLSRDRLAEAAVEATEEAEKKTAPPIDAVLQRAVHLHRALVAAKKI